MSALAALQAGFSSYLLDGAGQAAVLPAVSVPVGIDPSARLHVYRNAYVERLRETLQGDYPVLQRLAGPDRFAQMAYAYIAMQRSVSPTIRWFGAGLPAFLVAHPDWRADGAACAMASFEWAIGLAFDAADQPAIGVADLSVVSAEAWPELRFSLHPTLQIVDLSHAVADWWLAVRDLDAAAADPPAPLPLPPEHRHWAAWRSLTGVRFRLLEADEAAMLQAAGQGRSFADLCAVAAGYGSVDTAAPRTAGLLRLWVDDGWIAGFEIGA